MKWTLFGLIIINKHYIKKITTFSNHHKIKCPGHKTHTHTVWSALLDKVAGLQGAIKTFAKLSYEEFTSRRQSLKAGCVRSPLSCTGWPPAYRTLSGGSGCPGLGRVAAVGCCILPALTVAACRSKMNVTKAASVESQSHLFVFHLVVHLCISMMSARSCTENGATLNEIRSLPQSTKSVCLLQRHVWRYGDASHSQTWPFRSAPH